MADARVVVHRGRHERLRGEREVEHPRRLVGEHETDGDEREDAAERDAADDVADEVGHARPALRATGTVGRYWRKYGLIAVTLLVESVLFQQMYGLPGGVKTGSNFELFTFSSA